ncbi:hypothetical protein [Plantactinospora sp. B24E8]|uniref:hypothetical protein n=1 Tax=Plantactinospora sp. B24E8 TaxID=3153567 RepID=UPI00325D5677
MTPLNRFYRRSDPRGLFPYLPGEPTLAHNRLAQFWRPVIDLSDTGYASLRLRMVAPLAERLARGDGRWPWYSRIAVPGLRSQVLRHAGLRRYDCRAPDGLPEQLRTPAWTNLLRYVGEFAEHDYPVRSQVLFHLAQLSYVGPALALAGEVAVTGQPSHDRYVYDVARLHARYPGRARHALSLFTALADHGNPLIALSARFQGIGHGLRAGDTTRAAWFAAPVKPAGLDDWYGTLVRSRFHRALALLRLRQGDRSSAVKELEVAGRLDVELAADPVEPLVARENTRYLLESRIEVTGEGAAALVALDPYCVEAWLVAGDGHAAKGELAVAAERYARAGEFGTASGAIGWYRAGQCFHLLGDTGRAVNAMGRCLELDRTAVEPQEYLSRHSPTARQAPLPGG